MEWRILGPLEVVAGEQRVLLGGAQQRALLALLLLRRGDVVPVGRLVDELWSGRPPDGARATLRSYVAHLRKSLNGCRGALVTRSPGYVLCAEPGDIDVCRFEGLVGQGRDALTVGRCAVAAQILHEALGLWRGPVLADVADLHAVRTERARLEELRLVAVEARIEAGLGLGRHAELVGELETLLADHPLRERFHALRMQALYRSGRQADALAAYQDARRLLTGELGIEPGPMLRRLQQAILRQEPSLEQMPAPATVVVAASDDSYIGRERELARLGHALTDAAAGRGRLLLLSGEPGIGKTRTAQELAGQAVQAGFEVVWGRAWEEEGAPAFWPWMQALGRWMEHRPAEMLREMCGADASVLAQLVPELAERIPDLVPASPPTGAGARFQLFVAVARMLRRAAAAQPLLLVLDDLHRADVSSLRLLQFLAREVAQARLLVVCVYRDVGEGRDSAFVGVVSELLRESAAQAVRLRGLEPAEAARYVEQISDSDLSPSLVSDLHVRTGGNPFFLRELARLLAEEGELVRVPHGVLAAVTRRLDALPGPAGKALTLAAVAGREFSLPVLEAVTGQAPLLEHLEQAVMAGLVAELPGRPGRFAFTHVLVRDALYATVSGVRRARLHRLVGEAIEQAHHADLGLHLAELAHHFRQAGEPDGRRKAAAFAMRAGERCMTQLAYEEAIRHFQLALDHEDVPTRRCELLLALADAQLRGGETTAGLATSRQAARLARDLNLPRQLARAATAWYGDVSDFGVFDRELAQLCTVALDTLGDQEPGLRARLQARLAMTLSAGPGQNQRAHDLAARALDTARGLDDPGLLVYALLAYHHCVLAAPELATARLATADEIIALSESVGDRLWELLGRAWRMSALADLGDFPAVDAEIAACSALAEQLGLVHFHAVIRLARALRIFMSGDLEGAEEHGVLALRYAQGSPDPALRQSQAAQVWMIRRAQRRLAELAPAFADIAESPDVPASWQAGYALILLADGQTGEGRKLFDRVAADGFAALPRDRGWLLTLTTLADVCVGLEDRGAAADLYRLLLPFATHFGTLMATLSVGPVALYLGRLAVLLGQPDDARRHFLTAVQISERIGASPWLAEALTSQVFGT